MYIYQPCNTHPLNTNTTYEAPFQNHTQISSESTIHIKILIANSQQHDTIEQAVPTGML